MIAMTQLEPQWLRFVVGVALDMKWAPMRLVYEMASAKGESLGWRLPGYGQTCRRFRVAAGARLLRARRRAKR
jgi:hypothetical protein